MLFRKYLLTFIVEFIVLLSSIYVYRLASNMGVIEFSLYSLTRRFVSLIQPVVLIGMAVALPIFVISQNKSNPRPIKYLIVSASIPIAICLLLLLSSFFFAEFYSNLFFADTAFSLMILPLFVMVTGLVIHSLIYAFIRGEWKIGKANLLQVINMGIIPVLFFFISDDIQTIVGYSGLCWIMISLMFILKQYKEFRITWDEYIITSRKMFRYGIPRVPGDFTFAILFAIPPIIILHYFSLESAGNVAFGITLLNITTAAFAPISLILLPESRKMIIDKKFNQLKKRINLILVLCLSLTITGAVIFELFAEELLYFYLGRMNSELVYISRLIIPGSIGLSLFIGLRSIIDSFYYSAINSRNIIISFISFLIFSFIIILTGQNINYIITGFVISLSLLGLLTLLRIRKIKKYNHLSAAT